MANVAKVTMPQLGESVTEGTIGAWLKKPGESVEKYESLAEVITDKVNAEIPSPFSGVIKELSVGENETVAVGTVIALIALAVGSVFGDRGILNMVGEREKVESLRVELEELRAENARLSSEIRDLRQSPRAIERLAREELGLARADETVFLIREPSPDEPAL